MIVTLAKEFRFDAAHHLDFLPEGHKCRRMHGHTYRVEVQIRGEVDMQGFLIDYAELADVVAPLVDELDHSCLNDKYALAEPTTENLVRWFLYRIAAMLWTPHRNERWKLGVRVSESSTTYAESMIGLDARYFRCADNGEHYDFVTVNLDHAKWLLRHCGMETIEDADKAYGTDAVKWTELTPDQASMVNVTTDDGGSLRSRKPLAECAIGDWFTTYI